MSPWLDERSRNGGIDEVPVPGQGGSGCAASTSSDPTLKSRSSAPARPSSCASTNGMSSRIAIPEYVDWLLHERRLTARSGSPCTTCMPQRCGDVQPLFAEIARRLDEDEGVDRPLQRRAWGGPEQSQPRCSCAEGSRWTDALATVASSRPWPGRGAAQALFLEQLAASAAARWSARGGGVDGIDGTGVTWLAISSPPALRLRTTGRSRRPRGARERRSPTSGSCRPQPRRRARWRIRSTDSPSLQHAPCLRSRSHRQAPGPGYFASPRRRRATAAS